MPPVSDNDTIPAALAGTKHIEKSRGQDDRGRHHIGHTDKHFIGLLVSRSGAAYVAASQIPVIACVLAQSQIAALRAVAQ